MLLMLLLIGRVDEYVLEVAYCEVVNVWPHAIIDVRLESSRCVCYAERHDLVFELAVTCSESRFVFIVFLDPDEVISPTEVRLHKYPGLAHAVKDISNYHEGITIFHCGLGKRTKVDPKS